MQFSGLADPRSSVSAPPSRPEIFFVLSADEAFEIDGPNNVARLHEVQRGKRNGDGGRPALFCDASLGSPHAVPAGVAVPSVCICALFLGNQSIPLSAQGIYLKHVRVTPVMRRVNDDFEIVIQLLTDITPQFGGDDPFRVSVEASDAEIDFVPVVKDADLGFLSRWLSFKWLPLQKVGNRRGVLPRGIVKRPVQSWGSVNSTCARDWVRLLSSNLSFFGLCMWVRP